MKHPFHLSLPCKDLEQTKIFYTDELGASLGRTGESWADVNLFGHQITFTKVENYSMNIPNYKFEGKVLPSFHIGIILPLDEWDKMFNLFNNLETEIMINTSFLEDKAGEHKSFFIEDPNGYMLEFKSFKNPEAIFAVKLD